MAEDKKSDLLESTAGEEGWENEFADDGDATKLDPDALERIKAAEAERQAASSEPAAPPSPLSPKALFEADQSLGSTDFDEQSVTVMDKKESKKLDGDSPSVGTKPCPKCGVELAPGYPKCPRCKTPLLQKQPAMERKAGGTSAVGRTIPWTIVVILAITTGFIYYLAERESPVDKIDYQEGDEEAAESSRENGDVSAPAGAEEAGEKAEPADEGRADDDGEESADDDGEQAGSEEEGEEEATEDEAQGEE